MSRIVKLSRRDFLKQSALLGGGLLLACYLPFPGAVAAEAKEAPFAPNAFLRIGSDGRVTIIFHKSEMGQGVYTALPTIVAEELDCDWKTINIEQSPVAPEYAHTMFGSMVTGGSSSVRSEARTEAMMRLGPRPWPLTSATQSAVRPSRSERTSQ